MFPPISLAQLLDYAKIAKAAYGGPGALPTEYKSWTSLCCPATDTEAILVESTQEIVLAFRGTTNIKDALTDSDCSFMRLGAGRAHKGFLLAVRDFRATHPEIEQQLKSSGKNIVLVGHSLGGALALLYALDFGPDAKVVTFGAPRVGDGLLSYPNLVYRCVREADAVPLMPPYFMGFRHTGDEYYLSVDDEFIVNPSLGREAILRVRGILDTDDGFFDAVADHFIDQYISQLERIVADGT